MQRLLFIAISLLGTMPTIAVAQEASVRVERASLMSPRPLEEQTSVAVIRNYLQSWRALRSSFDQNRIDFLDADFVGDARDKFASTIQQQAALGLRTRYLDRSHDLRIIFYSPEGLSIELTDDVDYDLQLLDHDKPVTTQHIHAKYIAVLTPSESRWRVRVLQAEPQ